MTKFPEWMEQAHILVYPSFSEDGKPGYRALCLDYSLEEFGVSSAQAVELLSTSLLKRIELSLNGPVLGEMLAPAVYWQAYLRALRFRSLSEESWQSAIRRPIPLRALGLNKELHIFVMEVDEPVGPPSGVR